MQNRDNRSAVIIGVILMTVGVLTLISQFTGSTPLVGSILLAVLGVLFFVAAWAGGRKLNVLALPGAVLLCVALVQLLQTLFPTLAAGSYAWTLLIAAVGLGLVAFGYLTKDPGMRHVGWNVANVGLTLFLIFGIVTQLIFLFAGGGQSSGPYAFVWPAILIAVGVISLVVRLVRLTLAGSLFGGTAIADGAIPDEPIAVGARPETPPAVRADIVDGADADWGSLHAARRSRRHQRRAEWHAHGAVRRASDLFSPVVQIGFGALWLLLVLNQLTFAQLTPLLVLWPVFLIFGGINLLLGRRLPLLNMALGILLVAGSFYAIGNADRLGLRDRSPWPSWGVQMGDGSINERVTGSGTLASETRPVDDFDRIEINGGGEIRLVQGSPASLVIESDDNILPYITSTTDKDQLTLGIKPGVAINPTRLRYTVTVSSLSVVVINGAAALQADGWQDSQLAIDISGFATVDLRAVQLDQLYVKMSGSGSVKAAGEVERLNVTISGAGSFNGADLHSQQANLQISGVGQATVWASDSLVSDISGLGNVGYYGSPDVRKNDGGLAVLRKLGDK